LAGRGRRGPGLFASELVALSANGPYVFNNLPTLNGTAATASGARSSSTAVGAGSSSAAGSGIDGGLLGVGPERRRAFAAIRFLKGGQLSAEPVRLDSRQYANAPTAVRAREQAVSAPVHAGTWEETSGVGLEVVLFGERYRLLKRRRAFVGTRCADGLEIFGRYEGSLCGNTSLWVPASAADEARAPAARRALEQGGRWRWIGSDGFLFKPGGQLQTPWGAGEWGLVPGQSEESTLFVRFVDLDHMIRSSGDDSWESTRCADGDKSPLRRSAS
jgi:hypothetical protein